MKERVFEPGLLCCVKFMLKTSERNAFSEKTVKVNWNNHIETMRENDADES